jgi:hypothetical protein
MVRTSPTSLHAHCFIRHLALPQLAQRAAPAVSRMHDDALELIYRPGMRAISRIMCASWLLVQVQTLLLPCQAWFRCAQLLAA